MFCLYFVTDRAQGLPTDVDKWCFQMQRPRDEFLPVSMPPSVSCSKNTPTCQVTDTLPELRAFFGLPRSRY